MPTLLFVISDTVFLTTVVSIVGGMGAYIVIRDKIHRKDMKERNELLKEQFSTLSEMNDTAQQNIKDNTNILSGLKVLLEINIKKG